MKLKAYSLVRMQYEGAWASWGFQTFSCEDSLVCDTDSDTSWGFQTVSCEDNLMCDADTIFFFF